MSMDDASWEVCMKFAIASGCVVRLPSLFMRQSSGVDSCGWNIFVYFLCFSSSMDL